MHSFDRVCVISLARRPERLTEFRSRVPADFPFGEIEYVPAIDGQRCRPPSWWRQGGGAWGCYRTHVRILEECLNRGQKSVLIFEDDATFCPNFSARALEYLDRLPSDWVQAYLGGQHLRRPAAVAGNPLVLAASNVNRTHAYAVRGPEGMTTLYRWLCATDKWVNRNHIDHHLGRLHKESQRGYYAPADWLCGQAAGKSDISQKTLSERWWERTRAAGAPKGEEDRKTFVAVIGLHRSGSSAVAMMLHKLGVSMGDKLVGYEATNGGGGEAAGLAAICEWAARFPATEITVDRRELERRLRSWIDGRLRGRAIAGGKYPHLCAFGDELLEVAGDRLRVVVCDRPLEESIESLQRRSRKATGWLGVTDEQAEAVQRWLWRERERFLECLPPDRILRLPWEATQSEPAAVVDELVAFLRIAPTSRQREAAVSHIRQGALA